MSLITCTTHPSSFSLVPYPFFPLCLLPSAFCLFHFSLIPYPLFLSLLKKNLLTFHFYPIYYSITDSFFSFLKQKR